MRQYKVKNRIIAIVTMVAVISVMLFSAVYLEEHANHDCTGGDCPICAMMSQCSNHLKQITEVIVAAVSVTFFAVTYEVMQKYAVNLVSFRSLISQKVRMDN